jgi:hypothetical protein
MKALQLKITLRDSRPPIWRRVLIRADSSFWDLHSAIQDMFEWEDCHLHGFETASKVNEDRYVLEVLDIDPASTIEHSGAPKPQEHAYARTYYCDERAENLGDWITESRKRFYYTYDFGDSWIHEVMLEKIIELDETELEFAQYLGGKRTGLEEDSRGESILDCTSVIKAASNPGSEYWEAIVDYFGGKPKAREYLTKAEKISKSFAPTDITFSNPVLRYKNDDATGMFDRG